MDSRPAHIILTPHCLRVLLAFMQTDKSQLIRLQSIKLEELLAHYSEYQILFYKIEASIHINRLRVAADGAQMPPASSKSEFPCRDIIG